MKDKLAKQAYDDSDAVFNSARQLLIDLIVFAVRGVRDRILYRAPHLAATRAGG